MKLLVFTPFQDDCSNAAGRLMRTASVFLQQIKNGTAPFLTRFGSRLGSESGLILELGLGVGLNLRPYLDPTGKWFLARKNVH